MSAACPNCGGHGLWVVENLEHEYTVACMACSREWTVPKQQVVETVKEEPVYVRPKGRRGPAPKPIPALPPPDTFTSRMQALLAQSRQRS